MKDEDFYKMISGMMEAREKERMLGIRVLIIAHNAYKFQGCAQIYRKTKKEKSSNADSHHNGKDTAGKIKERNIVR